MSELKKSADAAKRAREAFFAHAKKRPSNKPQDLQPRTDIAKRMQSGSA
jgi:hypothetical protein